MPSYATIADLEARYPAELGLLAADETTGERDDIRVGHALDDASIEIRAILAARYSPAEFDAFDTHSLGVLRVYASDIALYRVALSFSRTTDAIKDRYDMAVKRLEAIAAGKGALTTTISAGTITGDGTDANVGQNEVVLVAPERVFTRDRLGRL